MILLPFFINSFADEDAKLNRRNSVASSNSLESNPAAFSDDDTGPDHANNPHRPSPQNVYGTR